MAVSTLTPTAQPQRHELALADWTGSISRSALQDLLVVASRPDILSFTLGLPAPELFPVESFKLAAADVLTREPKALQYCPPHESLKKQIVELMARRGVECRKEQVFLTTGAQQGVNLLAHLLLDKGRQVLAEELVYTGFQQVLDLFQPELLTVPTDLQTGMEVDEVERILRGGARPAFIYAITDGHNPLGNSISPEKRVRLVELARRYGVPIIEEDPYGFLCYEEKATPPMRALDGEFVFYVGSLSKVLAPALRVGWLIVPEVLVSKLSIVKEASDIDTTTFTQRIITSFLETGELPSHLEKLRREYRLRRDAMLGALETFFPQDARWAKPSSGLFVWVELPSHLDAEKLLGVAIETEKVAFIPGSAFSLRRDVRASNCMRLNFSNCSLPHIEEGIERLGRVIGASLRH